VSGHSERRWSQGKGPGAGGSYGPSGKGTVLQCPLRWTGDSNHCCPRVGDRQVSTPGQGRSTGEQRLKNPGGPWHPDSRPVAMGDTNITTRLLFNQGGLRKGLRRRPNGIL